MSPAMAADPGTVHLALPKGRMEENVMRLLGDAGIRLTFDRRGYRPTLSLEGFETKILKPQNIVEMLHVGSRDLGFAGADWVAEKGVELVELVDTGLDPVRIVAAADGSFVEDGRLPSRPFVVGVMDLERTSRGGQHDEHVHPADRAGAPNQRRNRRLPVLERADEPRHRLRARRAQ